MPCCPIFLPNQYRSEGRILPSEGGGASSLEQFADAAAMLGAKLPGQEEKFSNSQDVLESYWLRENLLTTEFRFRARSWRFGTEVMRHERLIDFLHCKNTDKGLEALRKIFSASKDIKTKLLTITAETSSPELSQQIVARSIELLEKFVMEKEQTKGEKRPPSPSRGSPKRTKNTTAPRKNSPGSWSGIRTFRPAPTPTSGSGVCALKATSNFVGNYP